MRYMFGLLFLAWGSSFIFNFDFNFGKYIFPVILIGIGVNIIFGDNENCRRRRYEKKAERYERKTNKFKGDKYEK